MAGHENGIPHFTLIFRRHDTHLTANLELQLQLKCTYTLRMLGAPGPEASRPTAGNWQQVIEPYLSLGSELCCTHFLA